MLLLIDYVKNVVIYNVVVKLQETSYLVGIKMYTIFSAHAHVAVQIIVEFMASQIILFPNLREPIPILKLN